METRLGSLPIKCRRRWVRRKMSLSRYKLWNYTMYLYEKYTEQQEQTYKIRLSI
jgi:hypothetical protein